MGPFAKEKSSTKVRGRSGHNGETPMDLGPLVGVERGFRTRERIPSSGGMGGVELVPSSPSEAGPSRLYSDAGTKKKGTLTRPLDEPRSVPVSRASAVNKDVNAPVPETSLEASPVPKMR